MKAKMHRVIYMGLPMYLCKEPQCNEVSGFWSWILAFVPFNGEFMIYEGNYFKAVWNWLTYKES